MEYRGRTLTSNSDKAEIFREVFTEKIENIKQHSDIRDGVFNGWREIIATQQNFFTESMVLKILKETKNKSSFGPDRIPLKFLRDGAEQLSPIICSLFTKVYEEQSIPEHWKCSRIIPLFKSGAPENFSNYRPISNLCSLAKIFEKCILERMLEVANQSGIDLTGEGQHGFKRLHSTVTAGLSIQHDLSTALDQGLIAACISLDLSAAFDVVNHELLIRRMKTLGIPGDICTLIELWLKDRRAYIEVGKDTSIFFEIKDGTIQGSVLGPILFAIFLRPLLVLTGLTSFADDNYVIEAGRNLEDVKRRITRTATTVLEWMQHSGLAVNLAKQSWFSFTAQEKLLKKSQLLIMLLSLRNQ